MGDKDFYAKIWKECAGHMLDLLLALALLGGILYLTRGCDNGLRKENERLREEIARQQQYVPLQRDTIRDTVEVVTQKVVEVERVKEVLTKEDKQLLSELDVRLKDLEAYEKIGTQTVAAVTLVPDTDSLLTFRDEWLDMRYDTKTNDIHLCSKDSLAITVVKEYRKRFLWWRWGVKGYEVKAVSFSPYTTIKYNPYIRVKE